VRSGRENGFDEFEVFEVETIPKVLTMVTSLTIEVELLEIEKIVANLLKSMATPVLPRSANPIPRRFRPPSYYRVWSEF
jgi:hypothetical protein